MAGYVNKVILVGNVGRDPEIRTTQDGMKLATLSIATSEFWRDKNTGERKDKTEWHRVVVMNERLTEVVEKYIRKGSKLYIEGQLQTRKWTDASGADKYTTEVVIGRFKGDIINLEKAQQDQPAISSNMEDEVFGSQGSSNNSMQSAPSLEDDDIPF